MNNFASTLTAGQRRNLRGRTYVATWFGGFSDLMLDNSALIIIYLTMLRAGNAAAMLSTGLTALVQMFTLIPTAGVVDRFGPKRVIFASGITACAGLLLTAFAPVFGDSAKFAALAGIAGFCLSKPLWNASWYTVLNCILLPEERAKFLGFMRFSYSIITGGLFFLLGLAMGKNPPLPLLQAVIAVIGLLVLGRSLIIVSMPLPPHVPRHYDLKGSLAISVRNSPLNGFSVYAGFIMLAFAPVLPMAMLYLKQGLNLPADAVQMLSCACIAGSVCGYFLYARIVKKFGLRVLELSLHGVFVLVALTLAFCGKNIPGAEYLVAFLLFAGNFAYACFFCAFSQEILALARPGNTTMAAAFANTYMQTGMACGRGTASFLLGCGALADQWRMWGMPFTDFQTLFLICAGLTLFGMTFVFCLPSVVPKHEDYYEP